MADVTTISLNGSSLDIKDSRVDDLLAHSTAAAGVDLTQYNVGSPFTAPYDGYVRAVVGYGTGNVTTITINNLQETTPCIATASISKLTFVKKGMLLYATCTGNATATYHAFT